MSRAFIRVFCRSTGLLMYGLNPLARSYSNFADLCLSFLNKKHKSFWGLGAFLFLIATHIGLNAGFYFQLINRELYQSLQAALVLTVFFYALRSWLLRFRPSLSALLHLDLLLILQGALSLSFYSQIEIFQWSSHLMFASLALILAFYWSKCKNTNQQNPILLSIEFTHNTLKEAQFVELGLKSILAAIAILFVYFLKTPSVGWPLGVALASPVFWPFANSLVSAHIKPLLSLKIRIPSWSQLTKLRFVKQLRSHFMGVFINSEYTLAAQWFDSASEFSEEELKDFSFAMTSLSEHPASQCLAQIQPKHRELHLKLSDIRVRQHSGIETSYQSPSKGRLLVELKSITWVKMAGYAMSSEALQFVASASENRLILSCLCINQRVVAIYGLSFMELTQGDSKNLQLKPLGLSLLIHSSQNQPIEKHLQANTQFAKEALLAEERDCLGHYWSLRESSYVECLAHWDLAGYPSGRNQFVFSSQSPQPEDQGFQFQEAGFLDALALLKWSKSWPTASLIRSGIYLSFSIAWIFLVILYFQP